MRKIDGTEKTLLCDVLDPRKRYITYKENESFSKWYKQNPAFDAARYAVDYCGVNKSKNPFEIKKVIFNPPATIVLWADGTKTVVKCRDNDVFDCEKGLAMAIAKKALGNQGNYYNVFRKHLNDSEQVKFTLDDVKEAMNSLATFFRRDNND